MSNTDNIYLSVKCIECPICYEIFTNPFIVNCEAKCIICEECLMKLFKTTNLQIDPTDGEVEEMERCICGTWANKRKSIPAVGMKRIIMNVK